MFRLFEGCRESQGAGQTPSTLAFSMLSFSPSMSGERAQLCLSSHKHHFNELLQDTLLLWQPSVRVDKEVDDTVKPFKLSREIAWDAYQSPPASASVTPYR
jgi:hypothetical protein